MPSLVRESGSLSRVNVSPAEQQANRGTKDVSVSRTGRFVAFEASASNLTERCSFHDYTIFVKDLRTGGVHRLDLGGDTAYHEDIFDPQISSDGSRVLYAEGNYYDGPDSYSLYDIADRARRQVEGPAGSSVSSPFPIGDGRFIGFTATSNTKPYSRAMLWDTFRDRYIDLHRSFGRGTRRAGSALVDASADGSLLLISARARDKGGAVGTGLFLLDRQSGKVRLVGVDDGKYGPQRLHLSGNGRFIVFNSKGRNWSTSDRDREWDIFLHDIRSDRTRVLSVTPEGHQISRYVAMGHGAISHSGRYIAFSATKLARAAKGSGASVYVYDRRTNRISVANNSYDGSDSVGSIWDVDLAARGGRAFFTSYDSNLVPGDTNLDSDVFKYSFR
ncbi:MAG: hypothetical protein M3N53_01855 [Actinomycetota bacterium]|nr:hypothetical protein [Actinomycetota bacterium]